MRCASGKSRERLRITGIAANSTERASPARHRTSGRRGPGGVPGVRGCRRRPCGRPRAWRFRRSSRPRDGSDSALHRKTKPPRARRSARAASGAATGKTPALLGPEARPRSVSKNSARRPAGSAGAVGPSSRSFSAVPGIDRRTSPSRRDGRGRANRCRARRFFGGAFCGSGNGVHQALIGPSSGIHRGAPGRPTRLLREGRRAANGSELPPRLGAPRPPRRPGCSPRRRLRRSRFPSGRKSSSPAGRTLRRSPPAATRWWRRRVRN